MGNSGSNSAQDLIMGNLKRDELLMSGYVTIFSIFHSKKKFEKSVNVTELWIFHLRLLIYTLSNHSKASLTNNSLSHITKSQYYHSISIVCENKLKKTSTVTAGAAVVFQPLTNFTLSQITHQLHLLITHSLISLNHNTTLNFNSFVKINSKNVDVTRSCRFFSFAY